MKTLRNHFFVILLTVLILGSLPVVSVNGQTEVHTKEKNRFEVGMLLKAQQKVLVLVKVKDAPLVGIRLYSNKNQLLFDDVISKAPRAYSRSFDFTGAESGTYRFEIWAGKEKVVREVQIQLPQVEVPAQSIAFVE